MKKIIFIILAIITYSINAQNILTSGGIPVKSNSHILSSYDLPYKTDLIAWYHGDKGVKLDANRVYQLDDLSGNSHNLTQSTSSYQPTWATGTNGRGYIQFDGSNDYIGSFNFYDALPTNKYNWAIYMVIDDWSYGDKTCGSVNTDGKVFLALHGNSSYQTSIRPCTNGISAGWRHNSGGATWSSNTVTESTKVIIYATATTTGNGGKVSLQVNNINGTDVQGGNSPYIGATSFRLGGLGATLNSSFKLYELIVFGNKPDAANKIKLDRYLSSKYSIPIAEVEDIPIKDYYIESILRNVGNLGVYGASYLQPITIPYSISYCTDYNESINIDKYLIYDVANIITPYCIINNINTYCRNSCWKYTTNYSDLLFNSDSSKVALIVDTSITCGYFPDMSLINEAVILDSTNFYN